MNPNFTGIIWMLVSCVMASCMVVLVRFISADVHILEIVFFRNIFALLFMIPWVIKYKKSIVKTSHFRVHWLRSAVGLGAMYLWFYALTVVPLAAAVSLSFTVNLLVPIMAIFFFGERYGIRRWTAIIVGFIGVLVVLRPGMEDFDKNMILVVISVTFWALSAIIIKHITKTDHPRTVAFYVALLMTPMSLPPVFFVWVMPTWEQLGWLLLLGFVANIFQMALSHAIAAAEFRVIIPFDFTRLLFTVILAYIIFSEVPDLYTILGGVIILSASIYTAWREAQLGKRRKMLEGVD